MRRRYPHTATTANAGALYPFMAGRGLGARGIWVGRNAYDGSAVTYDPYELYRQGDVTNPGMLIAGESGSGKTALRKSMILRQAAFGRQSVLLNPKREDEKLCEALGVEPIRLERGGRIRLNPLDPRIADPAAGSRGLLLGQLEVCRAVVGTTLGRALEPVEDAAVKQALLVASERGGPDGPTLPLVAEALLRPDDRAAAALAMERARLAEVTRDAALGLRRLCEDDLAGMFDGATSAEVNFDAPLVAFDLQALRDEDSLGICRVCVASWVQRCLHLEPGMKRTVWLDECWRFMSSVAAMRWLQSSYKMARSQGIQWVVIVQHLADLESAGAAGSEQARLAQGLLEDCQTVVLYQQAEAEKERLKRLLGLNETEIQVVTGRLPQGVALWRINRLSVLVEHCLAEAEREIVFSNEGMAA